MRNEDMLSGIFEAGDSTVLNPIGANYYDELPYFMRKRIVDLIHDAPGLEESRWKALEAFIQSAPDSVVREVFGRLTSVMEAAEILMWKRKLQDFISGDPPPPKYETHRMTMRPLEFLESVWGEYMDHGVLYQDILSAYDDKLIPAIYSYWNRFPRTGKDRLPPPKQERTDAILQRVIAQGPDTLEEVMHAVRAYERRAQRER